MRIVRASEVEAKPVTEAGATGATVRWLLSRPEGAPSFAMRMFELEPGGSTPLHTHDWEHQVFILAGQAEVVTASDAVPVAAGNAVLVLPNERHQFRNTAGATARFLCMIPLPKEG